MTLSDFFAEWLDLKIKIKKSTKEFARNLILRMEQREKILLENASVLSALFLDSRFRILLKKNPIQKQTAITHLSRIWKRIQDLKPTSNINEEQLLANDESQNDFDKYMDSLELNSAIQPTTNEDILFKLQEFDLEMSKRKRDPKSKHVMDYWDESKNLKPELYQLACVVFAAASTETSVERNFSALAFILNKYRGSLNDETLEKILFIRLNKDLFYKYTE